jgi:hypothetical protein
MNFSRVNEKIINYHPNNYTSTKLFLIVIAIFAELFLILFFLNVTFQFPFLSVNITLLNQFSFTSILTLIVATLSTILAIVFALSQFILSNIADKYSIQAIEKYENSPKTALFKVYILIITFTFFLLVTSNISETIPLLLLIGLILSIYSFIISFGFLIDYIGYMFTIINPSKFADIQKNDVIKAISLRNDMDTNEGIIAMGDITIKLMRRGEEKVCLKFINHFKEIFIEFMKLRKENPEMYEIKVFAPYQSEENKNNILDYILNEYLRVYKESLEKKQDVISQKITDNLYEILNVILYAR